MNEKDFIKDIKVDKEGGSVNFDDINKKIEEYFQEFLQSEEYKNLLNTDQIKDVFIARLYTKISEQEDEATKNFIKKQEIEFNNFSTKIELEQLKNNISGENIEIEKKTETIETTKQITGTFETASSEIKKMTKTDIEQTITIENGEIIENTKIQVSAGADAIRWKNDNQAKKIYTEKVKELETTYLNKFTKSENTQAIQDIINQLKNPESLQKISGPQTDIGNRYIILARIAEGFIESLQKIPTGENEPKLALEIDWEHCTIGTNGEKEEDRFVTIHFTIEKQKEQKEQNSNTPQESTSSSTVEPSQNSTENNPDKTESPPISSSSNPSSETSSSPTPSSDTSTEGEKTATKEEKSEEKGSSTSESSNPVETQTPNTPKPEIGTIQTPNTTSSETPSFPNPNQTSSSPSDESTPNSNTSPETTSPSTPLSDTNQESKIEEQKANELLKDFTINSAISKINDSKLTTWNESQYSKFSEIVNLLTENIKIYNNRKGLFELAQLLKDGKVKEFQEAIAKKINRTIKIDGKLGNQTLDAVKEFFQQIELENKAIQSISDTSLQKQIKKYFDEGKSDKAMELIGMKKGSEFPSNKIPGPGEGWLNENILENFIKRKNRYFWNSDEINANKNKDLVDDFGQKIQLSEDVVEKYNEFKQGKLKSKGLPYGILSKQTMHLYLFDKDHNFVAVKAVLMGKDAHIDAFRKQNGVMEILQYGGTQRTKAENNTTENGKIQATPSGLREIYKKAYDVGEQNYYAEMTPPIERNSDGSIKYTNLTKQDRTYPDQMGGWVFETKNGQTIARWEPSIRGFHPTYNPKERESLYTSEDIAKKLVSNGCVNIGTNFFDEFWDHFEEGSMVYVTPMKAKSENPTSSQQSNEVFSSTSTTNVSNENTETTNIKTMEEKLTNTFNTIKNAIKIKIKINTESNSEKKDFYNALTFKETQDGSKITKSIIYDGISILDLGIDTKDGKLMFFAKYSLNNNEKIERSDKEFSEENILLLIDNYYN